MRSPAWSAQAPETPAPPKVRVAGRVAVVGWELLKDMSAKIGADFVTQDYRELLKIDDLAFATDETRKLQRQVICR